MKGVIVHMFGNYIRGGGCDVKTKLFRLEVGVLLGKEDSEFECYNNVYTKKHGFYDEDVSVYVDYAEAKKAGDEYVSDGVDKTYCVITGDVFDVTEEELAQINETTWFDAVNEFSFKEDDVIYFIYKDNEKVITEIDKVNTELFRREVLKSKMFLTKKGMRDFAAKLRKDQSKCSHVTESTCKNAQGKWKLAWFEWFEETGESLMKIIYK